MNQYIHPNQMNNYLPNQYSQQPNEYYMNNPYQQQPTNYSSQPTQIIPPGFVQKKPCNCGYRRM